MAAQISAPPTPTARGRSTSSAENSSRHRSTYPHWFYLPAAVVYFVLVVPMNKYNEHRKARLGLEDEAEPVSDELAALREIRDLLAQRGTGTL